MPRRDLHSSQKSVCSGVKSVIAYKLAAVAGVKKRQWLGSNMWFTNSETGFRMSSFKSKIRRRKYALSRGNSTVGQNRKQSGESVPVDWEFVNFNPVIYGRRQEHSTDEGDSSPSSPATSPPDSRPNSRPPSWLASLPHHFVVEDPSEDYCCGQSIKLSIFNAFRYLY